MAHGRGRIPDERSLAERIGDASPEVQAILRDITRPRGPGDPRRHHYVPQFYLRRFAKLTGSGHRIATVPLSDPGRVRTGSVADTAVVADFYTIVDDENEDSVAVERLLGYVESNAKPALERLAMGVLFPPQSKDRHALALLFALQWVRDPHTRRAIEAMADSVAKMQLGLLDERRAHAFLVDNGEEPSASRIQMLLDAVRRSDQFEVVPPQNLSVQMMLTTAMELAPHFFDRHWAVVRYAEAGLVRDCCRFR